jgi:hypothetical protein
VARESFAQAVRSEVPVCAVGKHFYESCLLPEQMLKPKCRDNWNMEPFE